MKRADLEDLLDAWQRLPIRGAQLATRTPRTLLYGCTSRRFTHHVYLGEDQRIRLLVFAASAAPGSVLAYLTSKDEAEIESPAEYVPSKRLYPAYCDAEFCRRLMAAGQSLPFADYTSPKKFDAAYVAPRAEDMRGPLRRLPTLFDSSAYRRRIYRTGAWNELWRMLKSCGIRFCNTVTHEIYVLDEDFPKARALLEDFRLLAC